MGRIEWHDGLNLGVDEIDSQHKELISIINDVLEQVKKSGSDAVVDSLLAQLREYAVHHFNAEESFMEKIDYPELMKHKQIHKQLKDRVKYFQSSRFRKEDVSWDEVKELLSTWLIEHILREDYKVAQYAKSEGGGWKK